MSVTLVIILIVLGLSLLVVEVLILPGITVAGIGGGILTVSGVYLSFRYFGNTVGLLVLVGTAALFIILMAYALRSKTWKRLSLHAEIDGKVNVIDTNSIKVGDTGVAISRLAPIGKVLVHDQIVEGKSQFGLIEEKSKIEVVQVTESSIIVQEIK